MSIELLIIALAIIALAINITAGVLYFREVLANGRKQS